MTPLDVIKHWLFNLLEDEICQNLQAGGHCGLCGKWVPWDILPSYWAITLCNKCKKGDFSHIKWMKPQTLKRKRNK